MGQRERRTGYVVVPNKGNSLALAQARAVDNIADFLDDKEMAMEGSVRIEPGPSVAQDGLTVRWDFTFEVVAPN